MNYEKEYKEALERARLYHNVDKDNTLRLYARGTMEYLFPELVESEDERIRKLCEVLVRTCFMNELCTKEDNDDCIAWLEKQGEQNLVNETDEEIVEAVKDTSVLDLVEPNPAWSEYDEEFLRRAIKATNDVYPMTAEWLESLKNRVQPQWKPSEEQIKDFGGALLILKLQHYAPSESLESLYEQLKKL